MKNFIETLKKYKLHILSVLVILLFFRSCVKSVTVSKLEKVKIENTNTIDSLKNVITGQKDTIDNISEVIRQTEIKVHREYDNYISDRDRDEQLMELHRVVKNNIKNLDKK